MIPRDFITEWRGRAPWVDEAQVEQDLVICRALVEVFRAPTLAQRLAFRGGTALFKLHLPAVRYSEDIDLVQIAPEPIGEVLDGVRALLDPWLGEPRRQFGEGRVSLVYRFQSEGQPPRPLRLKIEINSREHFTVLGYVRMPFEVRSRWFSGQVEVTTFALEELLGTKLRALHQRRKGRDLFDLWYALSQAKPSLDRLVECFSRYMSDSGQNVTRAIFEQTFFGKLQDPLFRADLGPLLGSGILFELEEAATVVSQRLICRLPGAPWKGPREAT
jgi:predicted nucleotidyltransferase component of viral defense system